jgi:hypothetical protein
VIPRLRGACDLKLAQLSCGKRGFEEFRAFLLNGHLFR